MRNGVLESGERGWQQLRRRGRRIADVKFAEFDARRAKVVVSERRKPEGEAVVKAIRESGGIASFLQSDTSREADVKALVDFTLKSYGRLDFAFNNAGVEGTAGLTTDQQMEENSRRTFDINVARRALEHEARNSRHP